MGKHAFSLKTIYLTALTAVFAVSFFAFVAFDLYSQQRQTEQAMLEEPKYWQAYYRGTPKSQARERIFGQSDRCRYYLSDARVRQAMGALIRNLERKEIPYPLLSQFLPLQYEKIRAGQLENRPEALLIDKVGCVIDSYIF